MLQSSRTLSSRDCLVLKRSHCTRARQGTVRGRIYESKSRIILLARDEKREGSEQEESRIEDAPAEPRDFWEVRIVKIFWFNYYRSTFAY